MKTESTTNANTRRANSRRGIYAPAGLKRCGSCGQGLPFDAYEGPAATCLGCSALRSAGLKRCNKCGIVKDRAAGFYQRKRRPDGHSSICRQCDAKHPRQPRLDSRDLHYARFGITAAEFDALVEAQGGLCAICRRPPNGRTSALHVDHDHACCPGKRTCGKCRRGLICFSCNTTLGAMKDDPLIAMAMVEYMTTRRGSSMITPAGLSVQVGLAGVNPGGLD